MTVTREMLERVEAWGRGERNAETLLPDIAALCDLAEAVIEGEFALEWAANVAGARTGAGKALDAILAHLAPEEPTDG